MEFNLSEEYELTEIKLFQKWNFYNNNFMDQLGRNFVIPDLGSNGLNIISYLQMRKITPNSACHFHTSEITNYSRTECSSFLRKKQNKSLDHRAVISPE